MTNFESQAFAVRMMIDQLYLFAIKALKEQTGAKIVLNVCSQISDYTLLSYLKGEVY